MIFFPVQFFCVSRLSKNHYFCSGEMGNEKTKTYLSLYTLQCTVLEYELPTGTTVQVSTGEYTVRHVYELYCPSSLVALEYYSTKAVAVIATSNPAGVWWVSCRVLRDGGREESRYSSLSG